MEACKEYTFEEILEMGYIPTWLEWQDEESDYPRYLRDPQKPEIVYVEMGSEDKPHYQAYAKECINPNRYLN
ncbi:MAG TPA: hypothetical protein VHD83_08465 [Puia sp.]|nr:hypothetical protein [Puia sp.]